MSISSSFVAKSVGVVSGAIGLPTAAVYAHKYATSLYEVEEKVISDSIKMKVDDVTPQTSPKAVKVTVDETDWKENEEGKYYWECQIKLPTTPSVTASKIGEKLPKESNKTDAETTKRKNILVQKCSKDRYKGANLKKVKTTLDLSNLSNVADEAAFIKALFDEK